MSTATTDTTPTRRGRGPWLAGSALLAGLAVAAAQPGRAQADGERPLPGRLSDTGLYFTRVLPRIGGLISGDRGAYAYLPASVERFASPDELSELMARAGFVDITRRRLTGGVAWLHRGARPAAPASTGESAP